MSLRGTRRTGERIMLLGPIEGELDWCDAQHLGLVLFAHAQRAREEQFKREGRCRDCGGPLREPDADADTATCGEACPGWRVKLPAEVEAA